MPPKQKITKNMILDAAFQLVLKKGIDYVNSRNVAKELSCSTQPVFSCFETTEDLKKGVFDYACEKIMREILEYQDQPDFLAKTSLRIFDLARNEPNLFHLMYLSNSYSSNNLMNVMMNYESNQKMLLKMQESYGLDEAVCKDILLRGFLFHHGIATMIATNHMDFTNEQTAAMMRQTMSDMIKSAKEAIK